MRTIPLPPVEIESNDCLPGEYAYSSTHNVPVADFKPHMTHGTSCWCRPDVDFDAETTVKHRALDERHTYLRWGGWRRSH